MSANVPQIINDAAVRVNTFTEAFKSLASQAITATQSASAFTPFTASPVSLHGERPQYELDPPRRRRREWNCGISPARCRCLHSSTSLTLQQRAKALRV